MSFTLWLCRLCISEGLARELQEFPASEHWAKVVLNEAVSSPAALRAVRAASHSLPECKQGLQTAANESPLALL